MIFTHFVDLWDRTLSLFIGFLAFWLAGIVVAYLGLSMNTATTTEATATATLSVVKHSTGSAKSQFDSAVSILAVLGETATAVYWNANRNQVLSAFGSVRTKSAEGDATSRGVDFGSASLAKVLKHLSTPKREGALLSAAWAMASAMSLK